MENKLNRFLDAVLSLENIDTAKEFWEMKIIDIYKSLNYDLDLMIELLTFIYYGKPKGDEVESFNTEVSVGQDVSVNQVVINQFGEIVSVLDITVEIVFNLKYVTLENLGSTIKIIIKGQINNL